MIKFSICSDLHLGDRDTLQLKNENESDVLLLAGDICEFYQCLSSSPGVLKFFRAASQEFPNVIWVPGNHEYYCDYGTVTMENGIQLAREWLDTHGLTNVRIGNNETFNVNSFPIHVGTLWTSFLNGNPVIMQAAIGKMNDYEYIRQDSLGKAVCPEFLYTKHQETVEFLKKSVSDGKDCVVMTHHQPHFHNKTIYAPSDTDHMYCTDLSPVFLNAPNIKYWCAGHQHTREKILIGDTNFITNSRGYTKYERAFSASFKLTHFEV